MKKKRFFGVVSLEEDGGAVIQVEEDPGLGEGAVQVSAARTEKAACRD